VSSEREAVADGLTAAFLLEFMDGDFLVGCGRSIGNEGGDVPVHEARNAEVAHWAADGALTWLAARLADPAVALAVARALHGNTIGDPKKGEPFIVQERDGEDIVRDAIAALAAVRDALGIGEGV
jgi:hypothetical protein